MLMLPRKGATTCVGTLQGRRIGTIISSSSGTQTHARRREHQPSTASQARHNSSFIKRVMEQVKQDMDKNEGLRKAREDFEKSGASDARDKLREQARAQEVKLRQWKETMSTHADTTKGMFVKMREQADREKEKMRERMAAAQADPKADESSSSPADANPYVEQARSLSAQGIQFIRSATSSLTGALSAGGGRMLDATKASLMLLHPKEGQTRHEAWKAERDRQREEREAREKEAADKATDAQGAQEGAASTPEPEPVANTSASAIVIRKTSTWDRFGANLRDMPFLSSVYDNPLFDRMFAETELAQSLREMKEIDPYFSLADFADQIEHVIAPHVVKSFLAGDREALQRQCAGPAFAAVDSSMKEREKQKCYLDSDILMGPCEVELKGARSLDSTAPSFIWTFQCQQINCLRDSKDEVIEGAVDDIRTVYYAMAITRHPAIDEDPEEALNLEYPWQVSELAIVGNQQCW